LNYLLDTNVAIHLRDGDQSIEGRVNKLAGPLFFSIVTRVELEAGVVAVPAKSRLRAERLAILLAGIPVAPFDDFAADCYRTILASAGYSRRKVLDRMIAATALAHDATLVTLNPDDFRDIPDLKLLAW
jgi:tRNA(fMet)-specific endonuclease VapC